MKILFCTFYGGSMCSSSSLQAHSLCYPSYSHSPILLCKKTFHLQHKRVLALLQISENQTLIMFSSPQSIEVATQVRNPIHLTSYIDEGLRTTRLQQYCSAYSLPSEGYEHVHPFAAINMIKDDNFLLHFLFKIN